MGYCSPPIINIITRTDTELPGAPSFLKRAEVRARSLDLEALIIPNP